jgi:hypothetical protein
MLRMRRAQLEEQIAADAGRLARAAREDWVTELQVAVRAG